jgi:hypothetical protein
MNQNQHQTWLNNNVFLYEAMDSYLDEDDLNRFASNYTFPIYDIIFIESKQTNDRRQGQPAHETKHYRGKANKPMIDDRGNQHTKR